MDTILAEIDIDLTTPRERFLYQNSNSVEEAVDIDLDGKGKRRIGKCKLFVYGNEGPIPHFHIVKNKKTVCCVCLYLPLYFHHKLDEIDLSGDQKVLLDMFLRRDNLWKTLSDAWRSAYEDSLKIYCQTNNLDINNLTQPDYTTMVDSVH